MAAYTPVADLRKEREEQRRFDKMMEPVGLPTGLPKAGNDPVDQARQRRLSSIASKRGNERRDMFIKDYLAGRREAGNLAQGQQGRLAEIAAQGGQTRRNLGLQQQYGMQNRSAEQQDMLARIAAQGRVNAALKGKRAGSLPKAPDMMQIYSDSSARFFGKGREGKVLRDKYGDNFDKYMEDIVAKYGTPQQPVGQQQPSVLPPAGPPSSGTITGRGGVLAASRGGQLVDAEQYAQSLLPIAPADPQQPVQQIAKPAEPAKRKRVQALSQPPPSEFDFDPMTSPAFAPPQTLEEFERKRKPKKSLPALPGQKRMASLIDKIRSERALRAGAKRYY